MVEIPNTVFGLLALIIVTLSGVIVKLWFMLVASWKEKSDLQDKRLQDSIDVRDKYVENIQKFSQTTELLYNKLNAGK